MPSYGARICSSRWSVRMSMTVIGGTGRPTADESDRRRLEFVRRVAAGADFDDAAVSAKIKPLRALKLLSTPELRAIIADVEARDLMAKAA